MFDRLRQYLWPLLALGLLVACGNVSAPAGQSAGGAPAAPATARPAPIAAATAAPASASPAADQPIPESVTAEGYHVLGRADAPVTLTMYSDFL